MKKLSIGAAVAVAVALVAFSLVARAARPTVESPHLVSMTDSAQALQQAGTTMQAHARAMLDDGRRAGSPDLIAHAEHWQQDGETLAQRGQWLAMRPLAPGSLISSPAELSRKGAWGSLPSTAEAMLHDPSKAREVDLEALRSNGLAMRAEGRNMVDLGKVMAEEVEVMIARYALTGQAAVDLRQAAQSMRQVGVHLEANGQAMIDYAERLRQSMGYR